MRWSCIDLPLLRPPALPGSVSLGSVYRTQPLTWLNIVKEPRYPHFTAHTPTEPRCGQRIVQCLIITSFLSLARAWVSRPTDETRCKWHLWVQTSYLETSLLHSFARSISPMQLPRQTFLSGQCLGSARPLADTCHSKVRRWAAGNTAPGAGGFGRSHGPGTTPSLTLFVQSLSPFWENRFALWEARTVRISTEKQHSGFRHFQGEGFRCSPGFLLHIPRGLIDFNPRLDQHQQFETIHFSPYCAFSKAAEVKGLSFECKLISPET